MTTEERNALIACYAAGYDEVVGALAGLTPAQLTAHPLPGKWSAAEIVQHLADSEMTSALRLRRLLVEEAPAITGYDQDLYATRLHYNTRDLAPALEALRGARATTVQLLEHMTEGDWRRAGTHSEVGAYSCEDWLRIYAAHAHGHADQLRALRAVLSRKTRSNTMKPEANEYAPYYGKYVELVPDGDIAATLRTQGAQTLTLLRTLPEEQGSHAYAPGKWTIKQLLGHVIDTERIFSYRTLCVGRNDQTPLPGFEQDDYVAGTDFNARTLASLADEFAAVRQATVHLCQHFSAAEWQRRGTASAKEITARALAHIIAGHELYHVDILKTRYLALSGGMLDEV